MDGDKPAQRSGTRRRQTAENKVERSEDPDMDALVTSQSETSFSDADHPQLPKDVQNRIGEQLRATYNQIVEEPVPDHLRQLLERLKGKE